MEQTKQELWEERILALEASGLSRRAWSKEHGIPENQVNYWVRKLRPQTAEEPQSKRWVGLETAPLSETGISVQVGQVTLKVNRGFDHRLLVEIIRTLTNIC